MPAENTKPNYDRGLVWFICILPLFGLFLEKYADGKITGILIWTLIIILLPVSCAADCINLKKKGEDISSIKKWVWLSPMYIYKREKLTGHESYKALMTAIFILSAFLMNGFIQGLKVNEDYVALVVQNSYVQNLDNFSGDSPNIIGEQTKSYFKETKWDCKKEGHTYTVTCSAEKDNKKYEIVFIVTHDGFCFQSFRLDQIKENGEKLPSDKAQKLSAEILFPDNSESSK